MEKYNFQAYIVPLDDQGRREWISGFTGSNGDCVITKDKVIYFISIYSAVQNKCWYKHVICVMLVFGKFLGGFVDWW